MKLEPYNIACIEYVEKTFLPDVMGNRTKYMIYHDGKVIVDSYKADCRKRQSRKEYTVPQDLVAEFFKQIYECARNIVDQDFSEDDHDGRLTIHYLFDHMETMDRECYNSSGCTIESIVKAFLENLN